MNSPDPDALAARAEALAIEQEYEASAEAWEAALALAPQRLDLQLDAAMTLIHFPGDDRERIEAGLDRLKAWSKKLCKDPELALDRWLSEGVGLSALGELQEALGAFDEALKLAPGNLDAQLERAVVLLELCRFDESKKAFEKIAKSFPDDANAHHHLGILAERAGDETSAKACFDRAHRLDPEAFPYGVKLSEAEFDAAVEQAIKELPAYAREGLANATISVEPFPSDETLRGGGVSPLVLGLFVGRALTERSPIHAADHQTAEIFLYQKNLERLCASRDELLEEIGITVLHEVGHLLGLDEDDLYERGLD